MFKEEVNAVCNASFAKINFLKSNPLGYFIASMLAGMYVGFGILLIFTIGGLLGSFVGTKIVMGASFGIALSLVIIAGAELFTGNNFVMTVGLLNKKVSFYYTNQTLDNLLYRKFNRLNIIGFYILLFWACNRFCGRVYSKDYINKNDIIASSIDIKRSVM